jgi:hypothetical protein
MKKITLKLIVVVLLAAQFSFVTNAKADELEQLRAQVQIISDVLDEKIQEFSRKSTDKAAFDHADYAVARQKYFNNMKFNLQTFRAEVLEIYGRFEPFFKVANSSYYSEAQKNQMLYSSGSPLSLVMARANVDYTQAFETLLIKAMGDVYVKLVDPKTKARLQPAGPERTLLAAMLCNSTNCIKKPILEVNIRSLRYPGKVDSETLDQIYKGAVLKFNQEHLLNSLSCQTFHCFALLKSDMNEVLLSFWAEFGRESRKFYLDSSKSISIDLSLAPQKAMFGILGLSVVHENGYVQTRNEDSFSSIASITVNGIRSSEYLYKTLRPDEGKEGRVWLISRYSNSFKLVDLLFAPLVSPY